MTAKTTSAHTDTMTPVCAIEHVGAGQDINDLFLTVFEDAEGNLCAKGRWHRKHNGGAVDLNVPRSVVVPVYDHRRRSVSYSYLDLRLVDVCFLDAHGQEVSDPNNAQSAFSQVFVPVLHEQLLRLFLLNAEGHQVLAGKTKVGEVAPARPAHKAPSKPTRGKSQRTRPPLSTAPASPKDQRAI